MRFTTCYEGKHKKCPRTLEHHKGEVFATCSCECHPPTLGDLHDYVTGEYIRTATAEETAASIVTAKYVDDGRGIIKVEGRSCYVVGGKES